MFLMKTAYKKTVRNDQAILINILSSPDALITAGAPIGFRGCVKHLAPSRNLNKDVLVLIRGHDEEKVDDEVEPTLDIALTFFAKIQTNPESKKLFFEKNFDPIVSPVFKYQNKEYIFVLQKNFEDMRISLVLVEACNLPYFTHRKVKVCIG